MDIQFLPLHEAHDLAIAEAIDSVSDVLSANSPLEARMWARVEAIREKNYPSAADILMQDGKGVGISGWFPLWTNPYGAWSSATFLADSLRGKGLLPILRCRQCHSAEAIQDELEDKVEFVSSIEVTNIRSIRASIKYMKNVGWKNEWSLHEDTANNRILARFYWPAPHKMKHDCYLDREVKQFQEPIQEPEIEFSEETLEDLEMKLKISKGLLERYNIEP